MWPHSLKNIIHKLYQSSRVCSHCASSAPLLGLESKMCYMSDQPCIYLSWFLSFLVKLCHNYNQTSPHEGPSNLIGEIHALFHILLFATCIQGFSWNTLHHLPWDDPTGFSYVDTLSLHKCNGDYRVHDILFINVYII